MGWTRRPGSASVLAHRRVRGDPNQLLVVAMFGRRGHSLASLRGRAHANGGRHRAKLLPMGMFKNSELSGDEVLNMMVGGQKMQDLMSELGVQL
jgi:hypothetical protein